ncbi:MAG: hypothetical protein GF383_07135 [Candidatus Lokiarchaeota archaeon]|nr:hypothetical protein [Candidatus Lokiarchaeota archaeon]MBD3339941.1 hypothetical protein [Candidatus Lokiarchaeota archaeon]
MCNYCDCENYEKCSIVGNIPIGFCCPNCKYYDGKGTCLNSKNKTITRMKSVSKEIQMLREAFGVKSKLSESELEDFP